MPTPDLKIPGYRILEVIGSGGMATVYLAEQELLKRKVALKVMSPRLMSDPVFCERFLSEAQIVARLSHPHIVTIHEVAVSEDTHYMAMEFVKGETLHERITKGVSLHDSLQRRLVTHTKKAFYTVMSNPPIFCFAMTKPRCYPILVSPRTSKAART
jgi:serine/threonine protein kinase